MRSTLPSLGASRAARGSRWLGHAADFVLGPNPRVGKIRRPWDRHPFIGFVDTHGLDACGVSAAAACAEPQAMPSRDLVRAVDHVRAAVKVRPTGQHDDRSPTSPGLPDVTSHDFDRVVLVDALGPRQDWSVRTERAAATLAMMLDDRFAWPRGGAAARGRPWRKGEPRRRDRLTA
jgi:hypothetical protein